MISSLLQLLVRAENLQEDAINFGEFIKVTDAEASGAVKVTEQENMLHDEAVTCC